MKINLLFKMKADASSREQILINTDTKKYLHVGSPFDESYGTRRDGIVIKEIGRSQIKDIYMFLARDEFTRVNSLDELDKDVYDEMVTIHCYGKEKKMRRSNAIKEYREAVIACEGSEKERYANVLMDLECGRKYCTDGD